MDEHDPRYDPDDIWEESVPGIHWVILPIAVGLILALLMGCDSAEYDRLQAAAEFKDRFINGCLPRKGDTVTAYWSDGKLLCKRLTPTGRYGRTFPHAEIQVAEIKE